MERNSFVDTEKKTRGQNIRTVLLTLCVGFTVIMVVCLTYGVIFAEGEARESVLYCWSIFGACALAAVLQFVFFTPTVIKRAGYPLRVAGFGACLYGVLVMLAVAMNWFPLDMLGAWASFTLSYLVALAIAAAFFAIRQKRESRELNKRLSEYQRGNG